MTALAKSGAIELTGHACLTRLDDLSLEGGARSEKSEVTRLNELRDAIKLTLRSGAIPSELADEIRLVSLDSPAGVRFQAAMEEVAKRFIKDWDPQIQPVRFGLMDFAGINGCQVQGAEPPLICFNVGCFKETIDEKGKTISPVKTLDEVALIFAHEQVHLTIERRYNPGRNSKLEESIASYSSVEAAFVAGFDPRAALEWCRNRVSGVHEWCWSDLLDEHPVPANALSIYETALTALNRKYGAIRATPTPLEESSELCRAAQEAHHVSTFEKRLAAEGYAERSQEEKVAILVRLIERREFLDSRQLHDLCQAIRNLRAEMTDTTLVKDKRLGPLFDVTLTLPGEGYEKAARRIFTSVGDSKAGYRPIGRLAPLAEACRAFIQAPDMGAARTAARDVVRLSEAEPLTRSKQGLEFLRRFAFPQFDYPDTDRVERLATKGGVPVSWNDHVKFAREERSRLGSADIPRAMLVLGVDDERLYSVMDAPLALAFFTDNLTQISAGPRDGSSTVSDLTIRGGRAVKVAIMGDERADHRDTVRLEYLSRHATQLFERLATLPDGEERNAIVNDLDRISLWVHRLEAADAHQSLLGLRTLEAAPEVFVALNIERITPPRGQEILLARLRELHLEGNIEAVRRVFLSFGIENPISPPDLIAAESRFSAWRETIARGAEKRVSMLSSRLLHFAVSARPEIFTPDERASLLATSVNWLGLLDYSLSVNPETDELKIDSDGREHLAGLLTEIASILNAQGKELVQPKSWRALTGLIEDLALADHPLGQPIVMAGAGILLSRKSRGAGPTTAQIVRVLKMMNGQLYGNSEGGSGRRADGDLVPYIRERLAEMITDPPSWSRELAEAIHDWQTLYQASVLGAANQYRYLEGLLEKVDALPTPTDRLPHYEALMATPGVRIRDPEIRDRVTRSWARSMREIYGLDDRSVGYHQAVLQAIDRVAARIATRDKGPTLNILAKTIQSQRTLTEAIKGKATVLTTALFAQTHDPLVMTETGESLVVDSREKRFAIIDYLSTALSRDSVERLTNRAVEWLERNRANPDRVLLMRRIEGYLIDFHKNFWAAPLEARALLMKEILTPHTVSRSELIDDRGREISVETARAQRIEEAFRYTLGRVFPGSAPQAEASRRWVSAYIDGMPEYAQHIALSALLVAGQRTAEAQKGTGFAIASFLESMGPAETKAGQAAQGHPKTPDDIRADLARLKTHADEPTRWELFNLIDAAFPHGHECPVDTVGEVLGSASLYVAVDVKLNDGSTAVLSLLRPHALERAQFGFELMGNMVERFDQQSDSFRVMRELIGDARELADVETRPRLAQIQRERAGTVYNGASVTVDGKSVTFAVPAVTEVGDHYVLSVRAPGEHFIDLPDGVEKRRLAKAIMALELNNILSGRPFDNDRHGGNCRIEGGAVHHFDFGGMMLTDPTDSELKELGEAVVAAGLGATSVNDFVNRYFGVLRDRQARGEQVSPLLKRAQKALLSIAEYSSGMTKDDLIDVLVSAAAHELHPAVREAVEGAVMAALMENGVSSSAFDVPRILGALEDPPIKISRSRR